MKKIMTLLSLGVILLFLLVGCKATTPAPASGAAEVSEEDVSAELNDLNELEQQSQDLDDLGFDEAEQAVQG